MLQEWLKLASFPHRDDSPARVECIEWRVLATHRSRVGRRCSFLEVEPCLELDHAARQPARRLAEARILDSRLVRSEGNGLQVEFVEGVEEVPAQFEAGALPEKLHGGQTELLYNTEVQTEVVRSSEGVASDARRNPVTDIEVWRSLKRSSVGRIAVPVPDDPREVRIGYKKRTV